LGFLDESMKYDYPVLHCAKEDPRDTTAREARSNFPQAVPQGAAERHTDRPAILDAHQIKANCVSVLFIESSEPIPNDLTTAARPVEHDRYLARIVTCHAAL